MVYEVFIPAASEDGFDVTLRVEAGNWTQALKSGLDRIGEAMVRNVMCDIKSDNSIHVTDATTRRVFVIRELVGEEGAESSAEEEGMGATMMLDSVSAPEAEAAPTPQATPEPEPAPPAEVAPTPEEKSEPEPEPEAEAAPASAAPEPQKQQARSNDGMMPVGSSTFEALKRESEEEQPRVISEAREKTGEGRAVSIGRKDEKVSEHLIEDVFLEIQEIHEGNRSMEEVVNFVMDMVVEKLDAESGSILFADVNGRELYFATARGPKAEEIMDFRVPMGKGIVGFCAREGVSLAISDAQKDPRFYQEISKALGYETRSLACSPVQHEGRVYGAIEVINKRGGSSFSGQEISAMAYIGRQLAGFVHDLIMAREKIS